MEHFDVLLSTLGFSSDVLDKIYSNSNIRYIGELVQCSALDLLELNCLIPKSLNEILLILGRLNLTLGMDIERTPYGIL